MSLILYGYWRSGAAYRVRIGLNLKGLPYEQHPVDLRTGSQREPGFLRLSPQGLVPALATPDGMLTQSLAILEWLDDHAPEPRLLPGKPFERAQARAMAALIACDIHPLNNLRVLQALKAEFGADQARLDAWAGRWITSGFAALEALIGEHGEDWAYGRAPGVVDCCLIPQIYSARRFSVDLSPFPRILEIEERAAAHPAFAAAHPDRQRDAD